MKTHLVHKILLFAFTLLLLTPLNAQIAGGTYSIGSGGDYESLADVIVDLNANGISGNVTMEFLDGHVEDGYNTIGSYSGNADYELVLRPEAGATSVELTNSANGKILDFFSARNVTIDGRAGGVGSSVLTLTNNSTSGALAGISFEGQSRDITITHCDIIYMGVGIRTVGGGINDPEDIVIENSRFSTPEINIAVSNLIALNHNCVTTSNMTIRNNVIESPDLGTGSVGSYTAMYIRSGADISNNFIAVGDIAINNIYGIRTNFGGATKNINHNTIAFIGGASTNSSVEVFPFYFQHAGVANVFNNIIYNGYDCGSGCTRGMLKEFTTYGGSSTIEDNVWTWVFGTEAQNIFYQLDGATEDIAQAFPNNRFPSFGAPQFVDFDNNDLALTESILASDPAYRTLNPIQTTDIYGNPRDPSLATKGAVESPFSTADNNIYNVTAPEFAGVTIQRFTTSGRFTVTVENPTADLTFSPILTLAPGATSSPASGQPFDFGETVNFSRFYDVTAANGTDLLRWSVSIVGENRWPAGTYSVGAGRDFEDLTEAYESFGIFGIDGDVILELEDGYSGGWASFFVGPGLDDHTITIRPEAGSTEINVFNASTGGRNVILDGRPGGVGESVLTFRSLNFAIINSGDFEGTIRYVNFLNNLSSSNSAIYGLRVFGNTSDVTIENCSFTTPNGTAHRGALDGIQIRNGENITIRNNKFYEIKYSPGASSAQFYAIDIEGDIAGKTEIYNNVINIKPEKFGPMTGIRVGSAVTGEVDIYHNTINIEDSGTGDQTGIYGGISVQANPSILNLQNNIVSITSPGTRAGISFSNVSGEKNVDFNNISGTLPLTYTGSISDAATFKSTFINSSTVDVSFTDTSIGDLSLNSSLNNNSQIRTVLDVGIPNDIDGVVRGSFPMKGAYDAMGSGFNDILSLNFTGSSNLIIDSDNATVSVHADPTLDRSNLPISITIPPGASISPDPSIGQDYTNPMVFTVTSENDIDKVWTVTMQDAEVAPTDISLSTTIVAENTTTNTTFATFMTTDGNTGDTHTYELVDGDGDDRNNRFRIVGNGLQSTATLNFEGFNSLSIRVRTTDNTGLSFEKIFVIEVTDINEAPEDIYLDENEFDETDNSQALTSFIIDDEDDGDSFTVTLVSGSGDSDNDKFSIVLGQGSLIGIQNDIPLNFESQSSFSIRVRVTDNGGLFFENSLTINVNDINDDPSDILLSSNTIDENSSPGSTVGTFSAVDEDDGQLYTYTFISGAGDDDNNAFQISGSSLLNEGLLNFESKNSYNIRVRTSDGNGGFFDKAFVINVNDVNEAPTQVDISNRNIDESSPIGTVVGLLSTTDEDIGDTHTYTVSDECSACRSTSVNFTIVGNELRSNVVFDFETQDRYTIDITSTDAGGLTEVRSTTISINDLPASITGITLTNQNINENTPSGTIVGTLNTFGEDLSGSFTYELISGAGDDDNGSFTISGDQVLTAESFDFEDKGTYSIRIQSDDGTLTESFILSISVNDVAEAPTDIVLNPTSITENNGVGDVIGMFTTTDEDTGETHSYSLVSGTGDDDNSSFQVVGNELRAAEVLDFETSPSYSIRVETNDGNGGTFQKSFAITVTNQNESITVANPIEDQMQDEGFGSIDIALANVFVDEDGDVLTWAASSGDESVVTVSVSGSTLTISEVAVGSSTITVSASDNSGVSTSEEFVFTVAEVPLGLEEELNLKVYPNPVVQSLTLESDESVTVKLTDLYGRPLRLGEGRAIQLDLNALAEGTYMLLIEKGGETTTRRILKTN